MTRIERSKQSNLRIARLLDQTGPFRVHENHAPGSRRGADKTAYTKFWLSHLKPGEKTFNTAIGDEIKLIFGINNFSDLPLFITDSQYREKRENELYTRIGRQYQIEGSIATVKKQVARYGETADGVIDYLQKNVLDGQSALVEMTNEVRHTSSPIDLLLIVFDPVHYNKRARFEAKRKLLLMELAAAVDKEQRTQDPLDKLLEFDNFLDRNVWKKGEKIGTTTTVYLLSTHNPDNFECMSVEILDEEKAREKMADLDKKRQMLTPMIRRVFEYEGRDVPVYITTRPKDPVAQILKMLRKDTDNPKVAVEDNLGFMGVFNTNDDLDAFQKTLQKAQAEEGLMPRLRDFSDTLNGDEYIGGNIGSSSKTSMRKAFIDLPDVSIEIILHTNKSYLDYYHSHDVGHNEFIVKRLYDSGIMSLLFPSGDLGDPTGKGIYEINIEEARNDKIAQIRSELNSIN